MINRLRMVCTCQIVVPQRLTRTLSGRRESDKEVCGVLLSIVIPVFDAQRYVVRLLDSILTAGYDPSLVEIVLVDDGSNDASVDRIVGWMRTHDDVVARLFRQDNGGVSRARNNGLDHAEGEYVWFVDADDMLPQGVLTFLYRLLEDGHDFVSGGFVPVAEDDGMIWRGGTPFWTGADAFPETSGAMSSDGGCCLTGRSASMKT